MIIKENLSRRRRRRAPRSFRFHNFLLKKEKENCIREPGGKDAEDCGAMAGNGMRGA
jgi:hypothetical protein